MAERLCTRSPAHVLFSLLGGDSLILEEELVNPPVNHGNQAHFFGFVALPLIHVVKPGVIWDLF